MQVVRAIFGGISNYLFVADGVVLAVRAHDYKSLRTHRVSDVAGLEVHMLPPTVGICNNVNPLVIWPYIPTFRVFEGIFHSCIELDCLECCIINLQLGALRREAADVGLVWV